MENITDENYIGLICNGEFNAIPDFKIGELFESFFDNINYNVVKENKQVYVDFTGEATCDDEPCTILIRFAVDDNAEEFEIKEIKVDDEILSEDESLDLLEDIAYAGGAVMEDDDYCDSDCAHCMHDCTNTYDENDENDEGDDEYDFDDENDDKDDEDNS